MTTRVAGAELATCISTTRISKIHSYFKPECCKLGETFLNIVLSQKRNWDHPHELKSCPTVGPEPLRVNMQLVPEYSTILLLQNHEKKIILGAPFQNARIHQFNSRLKRNCVNDQMKSYDIDGPYPNQNRGPAGPSSRGHGPWF